MPAETAISRQYAGVLALLAFSIIVLRGALNGEDIVATLPIACLSLLIFAVLGSCIGQIAGLIVRESVRAKFDAERSEAESHKSGEHNLADPA